MPVNRSRRVESLVDGIAMVEEIGGESPEKGSAEEWEQFTDEHTGNKYYYHAKTRRTSWTVPAEFSVGDGNPDPLHTEHSTELELSNLGSNSSQSKTV